ncbi:(Fe-S)-binding protein [Calderihabitans maritimus]|uniref:Glycolate oxidase iron-sulfur subunit n=1 Tax=Calderihabitans maritimus TaxID=1246530 RepID=A0A1Z5HWQ1_9FIRM|nr:(Fe-S)-binding protein [Calderihabitans maritimus]GAW93787.1 hypothetical protein Moth_0039 [Calderihabitans maritimus]
MVQEIGRSELQQKILRCNRCGFCQDVCPTYKVTGDEFNVARGRIRLTRLVVEGKYHWGEEAEITQHIESCLLCKACVATCPSRVATDEIVAQARAEITAAKGLTPFKRLVYRGVFSHNRRLVRVGRLLRYYQKSGIRWVVKKSGALKLMRNLGKAEDIIPQVPAANLREQLPQILKPVANPAHKVAYYPGCAINVFYSDIGKATIQVLQKNLCQVVVPHTVCCGGPHHSAGDHEEVKRLARENIDFLGRYEVEAIITDCATCGSILKEYGRLLQDDPGYREKALEFSAKVKDINEYLVEIGYSRELGPLPVVVSYHDPCHLGRGQKIIGPPREILKSIPQLELREMQEADWCCGGAGSYGITHPEISRKILDRKMKNFQATGASVLATSCPACTMQLQYGIKRYGLQAQVVHPVQLLARAYQAAEKKEEGEGNVPLPSGSENKTAV